MYLSPAETSLWDLNLGSICLSVHPSIWMSYHLDTSSQSAFIDSCFYRDVLHIKISDKFNIALCVYSGKLN